MIALNAVSEKMIKENMAIVIPVRKRLASGYATPIFNTGATCGKRTETKEKMPAMASMAATR